MDRLEIPRPDDAHLHLRDGAMLVRTAPWSARVFGRAIVMPNLDPPVVRVEEALRYRERILAACPPASGFDPRMTLYLTEATSAAEIERAAKTPEIAGVKLYPRGATTNSDHGLAGEAPPSFVLEALERSGVPLLVHGETIDPSCDVFDRERVFLDRTLIPIAERHPGLRVVFEHITTADAADWVASMPARIAATITPQHLLLNRGALFDGGLRPHHYCLPVLKRERDRRRLLEAATSGDASFFLGTDSAPHERRQKESACGCAGIFSAPVAIEAYAEAFAAAGRLERLAEFASGHAADYYGWPRSRARIVLERVDAAGPSRDGTGDDALEVFWAGRPLRYRCAEEPGAAPGRPASS